MMFEYGMFTQLKRLQDEIKRCTLDILIDKGYTLDKAKETIENIKNFNVYETKTGFRIETKVDDFKIIVFHHTDNIKVRFYSEEKDPNRPQKLNIIQDSNEAFKHSILSSDTIQNENDALNQGRIVRAFEQQTNERLQKLEKCVSDLHSDYIQLIRCNNRNANVLYGLSERIFKTEQNKKNKENPS